MLSRFKIGTRLALAFGLVSLFLLGTLVAGVMGITATKNTAQETLETDVALASNAAEIQRHKRDALKRIFSSISTILSGSWTTNNVGLPLSRKLRRPLR